MIHFEAPAGPSSFAFAASKCFINETFRFFRVLLIPFPYRRAEKVDAKSNQNAIFFERDRMSAGSVGGG